MKLYAINEIEYTNALMFDFWSFDNENAYRVLFEFTTPQPLTGLTKEKATKIIKKNHKKFGVFFHEQDFQIVKKQLTSLYVLIGEELLKAKIEVRLYDHIRLRLHKRKSDDFLNSINYKVFVNNA